MTLEQVRDTFLQFADKHRSDMNQVLRYTCAVIDNNVAFQFSAVNNLYEYPLRRIIINRLPQGYRMHQSGKEYFEPTPHDDDKRILKELERIITDIIPVMNSVSDHYKE